MAYRADITQALTPSAPDISGAVGAIQSQAAIAQTLFGGISQGLEMVQKGTQQAALKEAEEEQKKALVEQETRIQAEKQAVSELSSAQEKLKEYQKTVFTAEQPKTVAPTSQELAFKADVAAAAARLQMVRNEGGITQSEYFLRVANLVDKYAAKYPGSRADIRKAVEQGSGLRGADLWAQQQFIDRLFTPPKQAKSSQELLELQAKTISENLGMDIVEVTKAQQEGGPAFEVIKQASQQRAILAANIKAEENRVRSATQTANVNFKEVAEASRNVALFKSHDVANQYFVQNKETLARLQSNFNANKDLPAFIAEVNSFMNGLSSNVERVFNMEETRIISSLRNVSDDVKARALDDLKKAKEAVLTGLKVSDTGQLSSTAAILLNSQEKSLDLKVKMANVLTQFANLYGDSGDFKTAMANPEFLTDEEGNIVYDESGNPVLSKPWADIKRRSIDLYNQYSNLKRQAAKLPIEVISSGNFVRSIFPVGRALDDAIKSPSATPTLGMTKEEQKAARDDILSRGVEIVNRASNTKVPADIAQQTASLLERDINIVGTAISNAGYGAGLVVISNNEAKFRDFMSKLSPEQSLPVKAAVNDVYSKSVKSSLDGLNEISTKYKLKTPLRVGIDANGNVGIIPPGKEYFRDKNVVSSFLQGISPGAGIQPISVPSVFEKYYPGKEVKPEFINEVANLAKATQDWNNKYLPRLVGSISSRGIVMGEDKAKIANEIVLNFQNNKPSYDFYSIPIPSVPTQGTSTGGGVVTPTVSFQPQAGDSERVTILKQEIASVEKNTQLAKKRLERAKAANDMEDVAIYEMELKRASSDIEGLRRELERAQKGQ